MSDAPGPHFFSWEYLIDHLFSFFTALVGAIALFKIQNLKITFGKVHVQMNSRLDALLAAVRGEATAKGRLEGRAEGRTEERTAQERRADRLAQERRDEEDRGTGQ